MPTNPQQCLSGASGNNSLVHEGTSLSRDKAHESTLFDRSVEITSRLNIEKKVTNHVNFFTMSPCYCQVESQQNQLSF